MLLPPLLLLLPPPPPATRQLVAPIKRERERGRKGSPLTASFEVVKFVLVKVADAAIRSMRAKSSTDESQRPTQSDTLRNSLVAF
jgi:hypothetical protein